ncbi:ribonuclease P protein component [Candidatus Photodesmus blepharus]|uniref:Ribonuclease P protein component n=1 Tax=Candidatus Photodesmus blepharonis TaxID=1179155 RepID=A0A084CNP7_9GAMM|nr:ribonuclease P protein component [Candidatus Photodesmus blepharus]KEY91426.1 ribonuclease P protein component [Candidatus Photodesmus blepharus]
MHTHKFDKELRLLTPEHYQHVFKQARRVSSLYFTIVSRDNALSKPRLGLAVPKKQIRTSVARNNFKRLARESFRQNQHKLPHKDFVVIAKKDTQTLSNNETFKLFDKLWIRFSLPYHG